MRFALCLVLCAALAATAALENTRHLVLGCFGAGYLGHVPGFVIHAPTHCKDVKNGNGSAAVYEALFQEAGERAVGLNGATGETPWWLAVSPAHTVAISPPEALELLQDKVRFAAWMEADPELAPHAPATYLSLDTAVYPAILKLKPLSTRGNGISIVHDAAEAAAAVGNTTGYLIQEAVLSEHEYSVKFAAYNGTLLGVGQCLDRHDNETLAVMHAGSAVDKVLRHLVKCSTMPDAGQMLDVLARIARRTQYSGIGNIQYKLATSGVLKVIEVNPRLGGGFSNMPGGYDALARLTDLWINAHELSLGLTSSRVFLD